MNRLIENEMKKPTLEEVKEHFKNAKTVRCLGDENIYYLDIDYIRELSSIYFTTCRNAIILWNDVDGYAEITKYKDSVLEELPDIIKQKPKSDFKKITDSLSDLLEYKNKKYGNSALEPMSVFNGKCKVGQRLDDKLARIKNGTSLSKNDVADLMGYLALTCVEFGWDNFDEFKD